MVVTMNISSLSLIFQVLPFNRPTSNCHLTVDWELVMSLTVTWMLLCVAAWAWPTAVKEEEESRLYRGAKV